MRSRNGARSRKGCVVNGEITKASTNEHAPLRPSLPPSRVCCILHPPLLCTPATPRPVPSRVRRALQSFVRVRQRGVEYVLRRGKRSALHRGRVFFVLMSFFFRHFAVRSFLERPVRDSNPTSLLMFFAVMSFAARPMYLVLCTADQDLAATSFSYFWQALQ